MGGTRRKGRREEGGELGLYVKGIWEAPRGINECKVWKYSPSEYCVARDQIQFDDVTLQWSINLSARDSH